MGASISIPAMAESWESRWQRRLRDDWPGWRHYQNDNARLIAERTPIETVFLGDSITEAWLDKQPQFFSPGRICRGISGETTPQMLLRMMPDVCDLKPRFVHIMAGTNDIAGNTGSMTIKNSMDCFAAMHDIATAHGIGVIFASVPPAASFPWRPGLDTLTPIAEMNRRLREFAERRLATYVDYHPVLSDSIGGMKRTLAEDGVHPNAAGYSAMASVISPVLANLTKFKPSIPKDRN